MQIINETKLDFEDVLIRPKRSDVESRSNVNLVRQYKTLNSKRTLTGIGIIAANMDTVGTFNMCESLSKFEIFTALHKFYSVEKLINFFKKSESKYAFYTLGITNDDILKLKKVSDKISIDKICIDVANGYSKYFVEKVKQIREMFPRAILMAGNVATPDMTQELLINGKADIIKIGIGGGSVCETRTVTGCGYYQLSAIIECSDAAHGLNGHICSDGGCKTSGDICKAFGAGTDFIMLGSLLSGCDECEAEWEEEFHSFVNEKGVPEFAPDLPKKKTFMKFYGMSSNEAMDKHYGGAAPYRASEGKCVKIPYKGPVKNTILQILGGLRSACSYVGTSDLKHFSKCTTFVKNK